MKKLFCLVLCVLLVFALGAPTFAEGDEPIEVKPEYKKYGDDKLYVEDGKTYILRESCIVNLRVKDGTTLIIDEGVTLTATAGSNSGGTIIVLGTLAFRNAKTLGSFSISLSDPIYVRCNGFVEGYNELNHALQNSFIFEGHTYEDGFCVNCGQCENHVWNEYSRCTVCHYQCKHENYSCDTCGKLLPQNNLNTGSAISEGSLTVVCTVAAAVVFGFGGFFLGRKKKKKVKTEI